MRWCRADSGHGMGTALGEKIAQQADVFAFLFDQLGMSGKWFAIFGRFPPNFALANPTHTLINGFHASESYQPHPFHSFTEPDRRKSASFP